MTLWKKSLIISDIIICVESSQIVIVFLFILIKSIFLNIESILTVKIDMTWFVTVQIIMTWHTLYIAEKKGHTCFPLSSPPIPIEYLTW